MHLYIIHYQVRTQETVLESSNVSEGGKTLKNTKKLLSMNKWNRNEQKLKWIIGTCLLYLHFGKLTLFCLIGWETELKFSWIFFLSIPHKRGYSVVWLSFPVFHQAQVLVQNVIFKRKVTCLSQFIMTTVLYFLQKKKLFVLINLTWIIKLISF